jgi:lipopolysaccharide/colanic/teichoic acid biosynthesis glycosyltransferase
MQDKAVSRKRFSVVRPVLSPAQRAATVEPFAARVETVRLDAHRLLVRVFDPATDATISEIVLRKSRLSDLFPRAAGTTYRLARRGFDLVATSALLIPLTPLMAGVAFAIYAHDRGPVFFVQQRAGLDGKPFAMLKFRSMELDADKKKAELQQQNESADGVIFKMRRDPRVTPVGRLLRRFSVDELPQLINVLAGDMSLIGPRPHPVDEAAQYDESERRRLEVVPGLTCLWQVMGRSLLPFRENVKLDVLYIEHQSVTLDVELLFRTVWTVISGRGAY